LSLQPTFLDVGNIVLKRYWLGSITSSIIPVVVAGLLKRAEVAMGWHVPRKAAVRCASPHDQGTASHQDV
jgi:hypothetical protein